jgi:hypothetical protein
MNKAIRKRFADVGVKRLFIEPENPWENVFTESFNGSSRDKCLNVNWSRAQVRYR